VAGPVDPPPSHVEQGRIFQRRIAADGEASFKVQVFSFKMKGRTQAPGLFVFNDSRVIPNAHGDMKPDIPDRPVLFSSYDSTRIPASVFLLGWMLAQFPVLALDVGFVAVLKSQRFAQPGRDLVVLIEEEDESQLAFEALAFGTAPDSIVSAAVQVPGGPALAMPRQDPGQPVWACDEAWPSPVELNAARPDGSYTVNLATKNDGPQAVAVSLAGASYPPVPRVSNFQALQSVNPAADTVVQWTPMGGSGLDFIHFSVWDPDTNTAVFETPGPDQAGALDGTATQVTIPANRLQPGRIYRVEVLTVKVASYTSSYCPSAGGCARSVRLNLTTNTTNPSQALNSRLLRVTPPYQLDVPRNSLISFRFSRAMNPAFTPVVWSGVNGAAFTYLWTDNNRMLLCQYNGLLPASTLVEGIVNLADFRDANNQPLSGSGAYSFRTAVEDPGTPADVSGCHLIKARGYLQTGTSPVASGLYGCDGQVELSAFNRVKEPLALAIAANATSGRLQQDEWDGQFALEATFPDKGSLDQFYPNGDFSFTLNTIKDGNQTVTLSLGATDDYPAAPAVSNLAALQSVNHASPVPISWAAPAGWSQTPSVGGTFTEIEIEDDQGNEAFYADFDSGSIAATGCTIPAGTLWPGRTYRVELSFTKIKDLDNSYGSNGAGFRSVTEFMINTAGTPVMPTVKVEGGPGENFALVMRGGQPFRSYVVEVSSDLVRWLPQAAVWLPEAPYFSSYFDPDSMYLGKRCYRLRDRRQDEWIRRNVAIQGTVWSDASHATPVAGAVLGTTLDSRVATTDSGGKFFLETDTPGGTSGTGAYTIRITAGPQTRDYGPHSWGDQPRNQWFEFSSGSFGVDP
jgi:hypothetical protein